MPLIILMSFLLPWEFMSSLLGRLQLRVAEAYIRALFRGDSLNAGTEKPRDRHENLEQKAIMTLTTRARYHRPTGRRVYRASKATASAFSNSREGRWYGTAGKRRTEEENWSRSVFQLMGEALNEQIEIKNEGSGHFGDSEVIQLGYRADKIDKSACRK